MAGRMMISAVIPQEYNERRKKLGMSWAGVILRGLESIDTFKATNELITEYKMLKEKQARTAKMLQQYIDESKGDDNVLE